MATESPMLELLQGMYVSGMPWHGQQHQLDGVSEDQLVPEIGVHSVVLHHIALCGQMLCQFFRIVVDAKYLHVVALCEAQVSDTADLTQAQHHSVDLLDHDGLVCANQRARLPPRQCSLKPAIEPFTRSVQGCGQHKAGQR